MALHAALLYPLVASSFGSAEPAEAVKKGAQSQANGMRPSVCKVLSKPSVLQRIPSYVLPFLGGCRRPPGTIEAAQAAWWGGWVFKRLVPPLPQQLALALGGV